MADRPVHIDHLIARGATLRLWTGSGGLGFGGHIEIPGRHQTTWLSAGGPDATHESTVRMLDESARHFLLGLEVDR